MMVGKTWNLEDGISSNLTLHLTLPKCLGYGKKNFPEITSGDAGNRKGNL